MAENERLKQEAAEAQQQKQEVWVKGTEALCKYCGTALEPDLPFCSGCGEKAGGRELECQFCKTKTSMDFCPHCGRRVVPLNCPRCGTPTIYDACENCGTILNSVLEQSFAQQNYAEPIVMSAEEAAKIDAELKIMEQFTESAEFKAFQKKLIERQILLEERDYFNKREKRIIKTFGSRPFTLELPDPEEEAFRMEAFAALEKTIIEREAKAIEDQLAKMFPAPSVIVDADTSAEDARLAEIERNREKMERQFNEVFAKVNNEVDEFKKEEERKRVEAERKRLEEEKRRLEEERKRKEEEAERQRKREIERRRLEEEQRKKRIHGSYYYNNGNCEMDLNVDYGTKKATARYNCFLCKGSAYLSFNVKCIDDNNIRLSCSCLSLSGTVCISSYHNASGFNFCGNINSTGTYLNGYWENRTVGNMASSVSFYKR